MQDTMRKEGNVGIPMRAKRALLLVGIGIGLVVLPLSAIGAEPPETWIERRVAEVEVDFPVFFLALMGVGGGAWAVRDDLHEVVRRTEGVLLAGCRPAGVETEPPLLTSVRVEDTELPRRFLPVAQALGAGATLALALPPLLVAEHPGRPALAGVGAWLGAWVGYLLGVRSYTLALTSGPVPATPAPSVRLEWKPGEPARLIVETEGIPKPCPSQAPADPFPVLSLAVLPVVGAFVGAVLGYSLGL